MSIPISEIDYLNTNNQLVVDTLKRTDLRSGIDLNYKEATHWYDGTLILSTTDLDGVIYRKFGDKYYKLQFSGNLDARWFGLQDNTDGWAALTKGVEMAEKLKAPLYIPTGNYSLSKALMLPNNIEIIGDGTGKTWINNGWTPVQGGIMLKTLESSPEYIRLRNMSFNGAQVDQWLDINSDASIPENAQSFFEFENIEVVNVPRGLVCNIPFQINIFKNVFFYDVESPMELYGWANNFNAFYSCNFGGKRMMIIKNQSEANVFYSCRAEGGGRGKPTPLIEVENATNLKFVGCYFEGTGPNILKEIKSRNGVTFDDCHFTGAEDTDIQWIDFHFLSDGIVNFINPYFGEANGIVDKFSLTGGVQIGNDKKITLGQRSTQILQNSSHVSEFIIAGKKLTSNANKIEIFKIEIPSEPVVQENFKQISGKISIDSYTLTAGGFPFSDVYEIEVSFPYQSGYPMGFHKNVRPIFQTLFSADIDIDINNNIVTVFAKMNYPTQLDIVQSVCTIKAELYKNTAQGYQDLKILI